MLNRLCDPHTPPLIMGILNITPDSFSDGGRYMDPKRALEHAARMIQEGADAIDIGGESSRPGAEAVTPGEQIRRVVPVIRLIRDQFPQMRLSIDTRSSEVARVALGAGANIVNDISAMMADSKMIDCVAEYGCHIVLMHMKGIPQTMQRAPSYQDVVWEVASFLKDRVRCALSGGIDRSKILVDPGIGFGKTVEHNLQLLSHLPRFTKLAPVMLGVSRKAFIGQLLNVERPEDRLVGAVSVHAIAALQGVRFLRVHDVAPARQAAILGHQLRIRACIESGVPHPGG